MLGVEEQIACGNDSRGIRATHHRRFAQAKRTVFPHCLDDHAGRRITWLIVATAYAARETHHKWQLPFSDDTSGEGETRRVSTAQPGFLCQRNLSAPFELNTQIGRSSQPPFREPGLS